MVRRAANTASPALLRDRAEEGREVALLQMGSVWGGWWGSRSRSAAAPVALPGESPSPSSPRWKGITAAEQMLR